MHNVTLPSRTAQMISLASGIAVLLQTLNTVQREDADKAARRYAQKECRSLRKGGEDYPTASAELFALSADQQANYLAGNSYWSIHEEAERLHPDPQEPQQGELSAQAYTDACLAWEEACAAAATARQTHIDARFEEHKQAALKLSAKARREACMDAYFTEEFVKAFTRRLKYETLWRAVRTEEDPLERFFRSVEAAEDADDQTQDLLWQAYQRLDVSPAVVPTSPAQS